MSARWTISLSACAGLIVPLALLSADGVRPMNFDEAKVRPYELPDPLRFENGEKVTPTTWPARRRELLDILAKGIFGTEPPMPEALEVEASTNAVVCATCAVRRHYRMWFRRDRSGPFVDWTVWLPNRPKGDDEARPLLGSPVVLFLNFEGNDSFEGDGFALRPDTRRHLPLPAILARGYAVMTACYGQIAPDDVDRMCEGVLSLWPRDRPDAPRSLGAWAWALSRGLDLAERIPEIDAKKSVVTGSSRLGKAALLAGARDERFAVVVPNQSGKGGVPLWKRDYGENLSMFFRRDSRSWFLPSIARYVPDETKMPFDMHYLVAAVAPRHLLVQGFTVKSFDPRGEFLSLRAASPVWEMLAGTGLPHVPYPDVYDLSAVGPRLGYVCRGGVHGILALDWKWTLDFADSAFGMAAATAFSQDVRMFRTTLDRDFREVEGAVATAQTGPGAKTVDLDAAKPAHEFLGLGVSFAEASCHLLMKLPAAERRAVLESVFGRTGIGLSVGRIHMGSSDYSRRMYSYDDVPGDMKLEHFSIAPDRAEVLPVLKEAMAVNPELYFFSSQWSPPGWMKENGTLCGGPLRPDMLGVYTDYFVRFFRAYLDEGVNIRAFTVQNEPTANQDYNSPTCIVPPEQEAAVIKMLVPKLRAAGLDAKPWLFDQNFNSTGRVEKCLADADLRSLIGAVAWHPYAGEPEMIAPLKKKYPDLPMYQTEKGPHVDKAQRNLVWWGQLMSRTFNAGCGAFCSWCLALDEEGQPNVSCGFPCAGFVEIHSETGAVTPSSQYKAFRHVSPFVKRGARILDAPLQPGPMVTGWSRKSRPLEGLTVTSFRNPDGSDVVFIAYDRPDKPFGRVQVQIKRDGLYLPVQVFADSLTTLVFPAR